MEELMTKNASTELGFETSKTEKNITKKTSLAFKNRARSNFVRIAWESVTGYSEA
jgi:hypothetical protein